MPNKRSTPVQKKLFNDALDLGYTVRVAAQKANVSLGTGYRWSGIRGKTQDGIEANIAKAETRLALPKAWHQLSEDASRALEDFSYFQRRYFGVKPFPWQKTAAEAIEKALHSDDREFMVINTPPGVGKTVTFTQMIPAWLICKDRRFRGMCGSATMRQARTNADNLRRHLERTIPLQNDPKLIAKGLTYDAVATLSEDFGRFKPPGRGDLWRSGEFIVEQMEDRGPLSEKEPTWAAWGVDAEFIGMRYPYIIWDDLVTADNMRSQESRLNLQDKWVKVCETRLEPGGVMILMGQRLMADDLYRFALDMQVPVGSNEAEDDEEEDDDDGDMRPKYNHIVYKAHYEELCLPGTHKRSAPSYPDGCLLAPTRLTWRDILSIPPEIFQTVYQQEDINTADVLVQPDWLTGAGEFTGCYDYDRSIWEWPERVNGDWLTVLTCDPSPTMYWGIQLWSYHQETDHRYLIAQHRHKMEAPDFLDFLVDERRYTGLLEEWWEMSNSLGHPFTHLIFEKNAAQRFFLQSDMFKRWRDSHSVEITAHTTGRNKADEDLGVWELAPHYKFARIRLPYKEGLGRSRTLDFVKELTSYPHGKTDDLVMAHWQMEWNLPNLVAPTRAPARIHRPSWLDKSRGNGRRAWSPGISVPR